MKRIFYQNSSGIKIPLDERPYMMLTDTDLFNSSYKYDSIDDKELSRIYRGLTNHSLKIQITGETEEDFYKNIAKLNDILDRDSITVSPGRLYYGDCYLNCAFMERNFPNKFLKKSSTVVEYTLVTSKESYWNRDILYTFEGGKKVEDKNGLNYEYNYEYNYTQGTANEEMVDNDYFNLCDFQLTIHGYAHNPQIIIGENIYRFDYTVQKEDRIIIDSINKTAILQKGNGVSINMFPYREKAYDIFKKIGSGENMIWWNGDYDIDILLIQNRGEPMWT